MIGLKEELRELAMKNDFQLFGVADLGMVEETPFPEGRGLQRPSEVMPEARSLIILGKVLWDEGMNLSVSSAGQADFSGGGTLEYYNFYYNLVENLAWRFSSEMSARYRARAVPTVTIHLKVSAMLAGLGWIGHNTLVITPDYGPRVRWVGVLTDMELEPDRPFDEDLCAKQEKCRERDRCVRACPYKAIIPGPSQGVEPGKKVDQEMCVVMHVFDPKPTEEYERHIRRVTPRGMMECTLCNLSCPYGDRVEREIIPARRGLVPGSTLRRGARARSGKRRSRLPFRRFRRQGFGHRVRERAHGLFDHEDGETSYSRRRLDDAMKKAHGEWKKGRDGKGNEVVAGPYMKRW
ncbi:MAG: epoxyqueuosine reductase [Candidatus Methanomethylophilaceae archaeon]|nr:epoxyqueuosine reductase [Candidatus Methanomethylophilaceae archaeon]